MLTLKHVSEVLGIGRETIRRAILAGELPAIPISAPGGKAYMVTLEDAQEWFENRPSKSPVAASSSLAASEALKVGTSNSVAASSSVSVPLEAHLAALEHSSKQTNRILDQMSALSEQLRQAQEALGKAYQSEQRAERRVAQLEGQLGTTVRMLTESAQSVIEQRAMAMMAEAQRAEAAALAEKLTNVAQSVDHVMEPKIDTSRQSRGWGSRLARILGIRKTG